MLHPSSGAFDICPRKIGFIGVTCAGKCANKFLPLSTSSDVNVLPIVQTHLIGLGLIYLLQRRRVAGGINQPRVLILLTAQPLLSPNTNFVTSPARHNKGMRLREKYPHRGPDESTSYSPIFIRGR
jgi:hypothetical protein